MSRQLATALGRAWRAGAGPADGEPVVIDLDSTICRVYGKLKAGAAYGYTKVLGYHPLLATMASSGEILHDRMRKGSSQRGHERFVEELIARVRQAGATGPGRRLFTFVGYDEPRWRASLSPSTRREGARRSSFNCLFGAADRCGSRVQWVANGLWRSRWYFETALGAGVEAARNRLLSDKHVDPSRCGVSCLETARGADGS